jgi:Tat protein secretion system quality control protein TatD with DNase activity
MREEQAEKGVMHCFSEDWETAKAALDLGFYISFLSSYLSVALQQIHQPF